MDQDEKRDLSAEDVKLICDFFLLLYEIDQENKAEETKRDSANNEPPKNIGRPRLNITSTVR
jgi:hypothetical protein